MTDQKEYLDSPPEIRAARDFHNRVVPDDPKQWRTLPGAWGLLRSNLDYARRLLGTEHDTDTLRSYIEKVEILIQEVEE